MEHLPIRASEFQQTDLGFAIDFEQCIVVPEKLGRNAKGLQDKRTVRLYRAKGMAPEEVTFEVPIGEPIAGHPLRLQASFDRIWQMCIQKSNLSFTIDGNSIITSAGGGPIDYVDSFPGEKVRESIQRQKLPIDDILFTSLGGPEVAKLVAKAKPVLSQSTKPGASSTFPRPVIYYDFAITSIGARFRVARTDVTVQGILFLHHRYEKRSLIVAMPFPARGGVQIEEIPVQFSEPFQCAVDSIGNYYFVAESGKAYVAQNDLGAGRRQVKPLFDEANERARVFIREAKTGRSWIFVQKQGKDRDDADFVLELAEGAVRRKLPIEFFGDRNVTVDSDKLWKCVQVTREIK